VKVPKRVTERLSTEIRRFQNVLKKAKDRDVNESDTVTIITDILSNVFGYDKYSEITSEQAIRGTYCDLAIKIDGKIKYLIEVKAVGLDLKENHLRQALNYGANNGVPWIVLTNGINWEIYKIKFEQPIDYDLVCAFNFTELNPKNQDHQERAFLLCKEGIATAAIEEFHDHIQSVNRFMIGAITLTEPVINTIRKELKRTSPGVKVTNEEIENILVSQVLKRDVMEEETFQNARRRISRASKMNCKRKPVADQKVTPSSEDTAASET
jgi:predicted type IV restriction endonuclease